MAFNFPHHYEEDDDDDDAERFQAVYRCYSAVFLSDRERTSIENGGKILLPESALEPLIHQVNNEFFHSRKILFVFIRKELCYFN